MFPGAEIDLIALDGGVVVFVEVKVRKGGAYGREAVTPAKQKRICKGAVAYMMKNGLMNRQARFDVIEIQGARLTHIKDAFLGSRVTLNNGAKGTIAAYPNDFAAHPIINISADEILNLNEHPELMIIEYNPK